MSGLGARGREWPLFLGMAVAALLVFASTRVAAGKDAAPAIRAQAHRLTGVAGFAAAAAPASGTPTAASGASGSRARAHPGSANAAAARAAHGAKRHAAKASASPAASAPGGGSTGGSAEAPPSAHSSSPSRSAPRSSHHSSSQQSPAQPPPALTVPAKSGQATAGGVTFTVRSPTHFPAVGAKWALTTTATRGGRAVTGKVTMDVVYQGKVVAHMASGNLRGGAFSKSVSWPQRSAGYPITVKIHMMAGGQVCTFLYGVQVRAAG